MKMNSAFVVGLVVVALIQCCNAKNAGIYKEGRKINYEKNFYLHDYTKDSKYENHF